MPEIGIPLSPDRKGTLSAELQVTLVDFIDLALQGKQAHWNVVGRHFTPLHEQLDALVADARTWADTVAERLATLGQPADGRAVTVAETSGLEPFPGGFADDEKVVILIVERLTRLGEGVRTRAERLGDLDLVSQDLLIEILRGLEKHLWMFQAQT